MSSRFPKSQAGCPHGQLLRQKAQCFKLVVEAVKLPAKNFFIMLFLLLQRGNFVDPPLHDAGASAAALDEIIGLLLIQSDLFFDRGIKFLRHFVALLGIVNDVKAVDAERIVILVHNILHSKEDAEECANDTYLGAWNSIPPQRPNRLSIYLGKITRNLALNRYKRYTAEKRGHGQVVLALSELEACVPSETTVEQTIEENELAAAIDRFLYAKPKLNRNIFVRRYYHLYAIRDIADAYGMSESKVTSLLFRMRNELRRFLEKEGIML